MKLRLLSLTLFTASLTLFAQQPPAPQQTTPQQPAAPQPVSIGNLSLNNVSLTEVIDQMARLLKINYTLDPRVKGGVILNTYGETRNLDARNVLETILRINNAGMVQEGDLYHIVPLTDIAKQPLKLNINAKDMPEDDQTMLNMVFLKYVTVDELTEYIDKELTKLAREFGQTKEEKEQLHFVLGGRATHYVLTKNPGPTTQAQYVRAAPGIPSGSACSYGPAEHAACQPPGSSEWRRRWGWRTPKRWRTASLN